MLRSIFVGKTENLKYFLSRRYKHKRKVEVFDEEVKYRSKTSSVYKALTHFDDFYGKQFGKLWPSIRLALLTEPKYCTLVNYYGDNEETSKRLQELGCVDVGEQFHEVWKTMNPISRKKKTSATTTPHVAESEETEEPESPNMLDRIVLPGLPSDALYDFVPVTKLKGMEDWVDEEDQLKYVQDAADFSVKVEYDNLLDIPPLLKLYTFPRGNTSRFPSPKQGTAGTLDYYLMDGASLLPVIALDLQPQDEVLDLCAAPGGKSLAILQTVYIGKLVSNDSTLSRVNRIRSVFQQYLGNLQSWKDRLFVTMLDGRSWDANNSFDKVLVDVPCTNDRHSVNEEDNNIFKPTRLKERTKVPELQTQLLCSGIKACKPGGTIVYSTCSLSPIQNDGVVHMAIKKIKEDHNIDIVVKNISKTMRCFGFMFRFAPSSLLRYGQLVVPVLPNNFGPMYIAKLQRLN